MKRYILFDFDGTLADSLFIGIEVLKRLQGKYQSKAPTLTMIRNLGLRGVIKKTHFPLIKLPTLVRDVRTELSKKILEVSLFSGWTRVLPVLAKKYTLGIVSSNSTENVNVFLKHHNIQDWFDFVYSNNSVFGKQVVLKRLCKKRGIGLNELVYVGDEDRDIQAGRKLGIPVIAVSWGYNSKRLLQKAKAEHIIKTPLEVIKVIDTLK
ncbi:MAG: HAD-IA family hydrolase [Nanoarchaeota archaeon]